MVGLDVGRKILGSVESIKNALDVTTRTSDEYERASPRAAGVAADWIRLAISSALGVVSCTTESA